jgi:signal transduction histidine kinase
MSTTMLVGCAVWTLAAIVACTFGGYLRMLDQQRAQAVLADRREQRLHLASELHDFVAHDVSGILALAQAGQLLPVDQTPQVAQLLHAIEQAAGSALVSMDRTIRLLHGSGMATGPTMEDLPDLLARFAATHPATVRVDVRSTLPREISGTAYRVIVEALTNIRRHAPGATGVDIIVRTTGETATIQVADNGGPTPTGHPRLGGLGIAGLAERIRLLGGTMEAGPCPSAGWCLRAVLPLAGTAAASVT